MNMNSPVFPVPETASQVCAIMVTYNPGNSICGNIEALSRQVEHIVIVDNGSAARDFLDTRQFQSDQITIVEHETNHGIAAGFNTGIQKAKELSFQWVLLMDQDSTLKNECIHNMISTWRSHALAGQVAMIGPNYAGPNKYQTGISESLERWSGSVRKRDIISSGSLMPISLYEHVGPFMEELFIDLVDIEFCWRVNKIGGTCIVATEAQMDHQLGKSIPTPLLGELAAHNPTRTYYRVRNAILFIKMIGVKDLKLYLVRWRKLIFLIIQKTLFGRPWLEQMNSIFRGIKDGIIGRTGPYKKQ
jgi:rhamnosyltransferase